MYLDEHFDHIASLASGEERRRYLAELAAQEPKTAERLSLLLRDPADSCPSWAAITLSRGESLDRPLSACQPGMIIDGKYRLTELIGRGSSGVVWKAEAVAGLAAVYALKLFPASGYDAANVVAEAETVVQLEDPRILKVFDYGQDGVDGPPYIVMEFIAGQSLDKAAPIVAEKAIELMIDTCTAVAAAHRKNVLHRDLKPHNLIHTTDGRLKVVDFGIALRGTVANASAAMPATETMSMTLGSNRVVGTPAYIAPEVLAGGPATERSDIYSLGATLFHLLAGGPPYRARPGSEVPWLDIVDQVLEEAPMPLPRSPGVRRRLERIIRRAMARDPFDRYDSVEEMRRDLELYRSKLPTIADGKSLLARLEVFGERRKGLLLLASFLLSLCVLAGQMIGHVNGTLRGMEEETRASASAAAKVEAQLKAQLKREHEERETAIRERDAEMSRADELAKQIAVLTRTVVTEKGACAARESAHDAGEAQALALIGEISAQEKLRAAEVVALTRELSVERARAAELEKVKVALIARVSSAEADAESFKEIIDTENAERAEKEKRRQAEEAKKRAAVARRIFSTSTEYLTR